MEGFVSFSRTGDEVLPYLTGEFSRDFAALPVRSVNSTAQSDRLTFQIIRRPKISLLKKISAVFKLMRLELLPLTLGPLIVVWFRFAQGNLSEFLLNLSGLSFVHAGIFVLNDYFDYVGGVDQVKEKGGTRVLITGLVRAISAKRLGIFLLVVGVGFAIPLFYARPILLLIALVGGALGIFGHARFRKGASVFISFGPLLLLGIGISLGLGRQRLISTSFLSLVAFYGLSAVLYFHVRQFVSLMDDSRAGLNTFATTLGFDRTKVALYFEVSTIVLLTWILKFGTFEFLAAGVLGALLNLSIFKIRSSVSSALDKLQTYTLVFVGCMSLLFVLLQVIGF